ncbi:filaggrin-2 [Microplitis demolitor]|uniref:filaggrin-2 n=1 Tax=Microplitis demolitor TaxID=69319 RepID=UPI00235B6076|nr:filaggrin-2 [Microplitis demolitor]
MKFIEFRIILFIASWTMLHGHILQGLKNKLHYKHTVITDNDENHVGYDVEADESNNHEIGVKSQKSLKYSINIDPVGTLSNTFKYGVDVSKKVGGLSSTAIQTGKEAIVSAAEKLGSIVSKKSKVTVDYKVEKNVMKSHELHGSMSTNHGVEVATGLKGSSGEINIQLYKNGQHQYGTNYDHKSSVTANNAYQTSLLNPGISVLSSQSLYGGTTGTNVGVNSELHQGESTVNYNQETTGFSGHGFQAHGSKSTEHFSYGSPQLTIELNKNGQHQYGTNYDHKSSVTANNAYQTSLLNPGISVISSQSLYGGTTGTNVGVNSELHQGESTVNYNQEATGFSGHGFQAHGSKSTEHFSYGSPQLTIELNKNGQHQYGTNYDHKSSVTFNNAYQTSLLNPGISVISSQSLYGGTTGTNVGVNSELHQGESTVNYNQEATGFSGHRFQAHGSKSTEHSSYSSPQQLTIELNKNGQHQYGTNYDHKSSVTANNAYQTSLLNPGISVISSQSLYGGTTGTNVGVNSELHQGESTVNYNQEATGFSGHRFQAHGSKSTEHSSYSSPQQLTIELNKNGQHQYGTNYDHKSSVAANNAYQTSLLNPGISVLSSQSLYGGTTGTNVGVNSELHQGESTVNYNQEATGFSGHRFQAHGSKSTEHSSYSSPQQLTIELNKNGQHQYGTNYDHKSSVAANNAYQTSLLNPGISVLSSQSLYGGTTGTNVGVNSELHQGESTVNYNQEATGFSGHRFQAHRSKSTEHSSYSSPQQLTIELNKNGQHQYGTNYDHKSSVAANNAYQTSLLNPGISVLSSQSLYGGTTGTNVGVNSELHQGESTVNYNQEATGFSGHRFQAHRSKSTEHSSYSSPQQLTIELNKNGQHQYGTNYDHKSSVAANNAYQTSLLNPGISELSSQSLYRGSMSVNIGVSKSIADKHHFEDKVELKNNLNSNSEGILHKPFKLVSRVAGKLRDAAESAAKTGKTRAQTAAQLLKNGITIKSEISLNHEVDNHVSSSHH